MTYYRGDVRRDSVWSVGGHHYGVIAGVHRYLIDIGGVTAIPALSPVFWRVVYRAGST